MPAPTVAALLDVARDLMLQRDFDIEVVRKLLSNLPVDDLNLQTRGAIKHAKIVATAAGDGGTSGTAVSRFALARVVLLLERHVEA